MSSICDLKNISNEFFNLHWPLQKNSGPQPTWIRWEPFLRGSAPNYKLGGCYALFSREELIYVGVGVAKGRGSTLYHGISRRLSGHVLRIDRYENEFQFYKLTDKWTDATDIYTIGFSNEIEYLALALEEFLIRKLSPIKNLR